MAKHQKPTPVRGKARVPERAFKSPMAVASAPGRSVAPPPPPPGPSPEAVALFQQGMEALQQHHYGPAAESFKALIDRHPLERALLDRARVYLELCNREMSKRPTEPRTIEERLTAATAALNNGAHDRAESLARGVLAEDPHQDLALYLLAVIEVRRGALDKGLSYLGQAIAISPEARAQARHEPDFEPLFDLPAFQELTELPAQASAAGAARKPKRLIR
jgi:tetratricopeptide (TPR) repeat protein